MFIYTLFNYIVGILCFVAFLYVVFRIFCWRHGDENILIAGHRRTKFVLEDMSFNQMVLVTDIPFSNRGKQNGTIMDLYPRHLLPQEQFDAVHVESWTTNANAERHDGYWPAEIIEPRKGGVIRLRVILTGKSGSIRNDAKGFPDMNIDIVYQVVGRSDWHIAKERIVLTAEEVEQALRQ